MPSRRLLVTLLAGVSLLLFAQFSNAQAVVVAEFDFQDQFGVPDAQGWSPQWRFENTEAYFHVDDLSGSGQIISALSGTRSMWCGISAEDPRSCRWFQPPGYGASWRQNLRSIEFPVQGDVDIDFVMAIASEPGYDYAYLQYQDLDGAWQNLDLYNGDCTQSSCGPVARSYTVPAAAHDGSLAFRFFFESDGAGDAETFLFGLNFPVGFVVDDIQISDALGTVDFQDFEGEALAALATSDGHWFAEPNTDVDGAAGLFSGSDVLQEAATTNDTPLWGFLEGSTRDYACAGHPEQAVVDETYSFALSPRIDLMHDLQGNAISGGMDSLVVEFDLYRDFTGPDTKSAQWYISEYSGTCQIRRFAENGGTAGGGPSWERLAIVWVPDPEAESIEIHLGVFNHSVNPQDCGSVSPLYDNVTVLRYGGSVVTAVDDRPGPSRLVLSQNRPNPFNPSTSLSFELPRDARQASLRVYDVAGRLVRTLFESSLSAGPYERRWDGRDASGRVVASGVYVAELVADELRETRRMVLLK